MSHKTHNMNPNSLKNLVRGRTGHPNKPDCIVALAREMLKERKVPGQTLTWEQAIAHSLVSQAASGNLDAIKELLNRLYGKSVQPLSGTGEGGIITINVISNIPRPEVNAH